MSESQSARKLVLITYCLTFIRGIAICELIFLTSEIILQPYASSVSSQMCLAAQLRISFSRDFERRRLGLGWICYCADACDRASVVLLTSFFVADSATCVNEEHLERREWSGRKRTTERPPVKQLLVITDPMRSNFCKLLIAHLKYMAYMSYQSREQTQSLHPDIPSISSGASFLPPSYFSNV